MVLLYVHFLFHVVHGPLVVSFAVFVLLTERNWGAGTGTRGGRTHHHLAIDGDVIRDEASIVLNVGDAGEEQNPFQLSVVKEVYEIPKRPVAVKGIPRVDCVVRVYVDVFQIDGGVDAPPQFVGEWRRRARREGCYQLFS